MTVNFAELRVLVVDDQMLVRTLLGQALRTMGFRPDSVLQAVDGSTALRTLDVKTVDIVLCDIEMQPLNGLDLLKELRCGKTMNPPNLPFVFLSGHAERQNVLIAAQLHADGFIVKPPKPADVEKAIETALGRPRPEIDPFHYYSVATGTEHDRRFYGEAIRAAAFDGQPWQALPLAQIKPGALLAHDLISQSGHLLLPAGSRLTATQLRALRDFRERYGVQSVDVADEPQ
ncbi:MULTISPECIES: response regulator [Gulbenkiania]|uniref:Response regulator receiver domain n=1 Tax=Gulbenkiania indica TaxID=375574 RepID=A0A0K6GRZ1_9NEIS|nr:MULTISPECIES: response regulator [Gulbenkiania]CUA81392.1 Response regulator receiver domain [Gulbenkiania indica]